MVSPSETEVEPEPASGFALGVGWEMITTHFFSCGDFLATLCEAGNEIDRSLPAHAWTVTPATDGYAMRLGIPNCDGLLALLTAAQRHARFRYVLQVQSLPLDSVRRTERAIDTDVMVWNTASAKINRSD